MLKNKKVLYFLIVILPFLLSTFIFYHYLKERETASQIERLEWVASIHKKQMDQFIGETKITLEILSISLEHMLGDHPGIKTTLEKTVGKDPRYGGIYLLDFAGNVTVGTNDSLKQYNLRDKAYIKEVLLTKHTVVSDLQETLANNQSVIAIATPIIRDDKVKSMLVAHIQLDYVQNIIGLLTPEQAIMFENAKGIPIFTVNGSNHIFNKTETASYPLEQLPWNIVLEKNKVDVSDVWGTTAIFGLAMLIIYHVVYLLFKYSMLKRQTKIERQQNEAQKLELIGTLAASTAHEIRNPITGIQGLVQLLSEKHLDDKDQFYFSVIKKEIDRINQIVSEFLILGKPTAQKIHVVDLKKIVTDVNPIIISEANLYNTEYEAVIPEEEIPVLCADDQMKQVILNIAKNAFEALHSGGKLQIAVRRDRSNGCISIRDNGPGIQEKDVTQIFEPFYTSKENGTGLGLVVCKRIVESFGGTIEITSSNPSGTCVTITLPLCLKERMP